MRLILDELMYNPPDVHSNTRTRWPDVYHPGQTDVQPSGWMIPIVERAVLTCAILDKLISSLPDVSPRWWINLTRQPNVYYPGPADVWLSRCTNSIAYQPGKATWGIVSSVAPRVSLLHLGLDLGGNSVSGAITPQAALNPMKYQPRLHRTEPSTFPVGPVFSSPMFPPLIVFCLIFCQRDPGHHTRDCELSASSFQIFNHNRLYAGESSHGWRLTTYIAGCLYQGFRRVIYPFPCDEVDPWWKVCEKIWSMIKFRSRNPGVKFGGRPK